jgi:hypothetical protein
MSDDQLRDAVFHFEAKRAEREAIELLALVNPSGAAIPNLIAEEFNRTGSFEGYERWISHAANKGMKDFFVSLGKVLEGKRLKPNTWSKLDEDVARILCFYPKIKSTDAIKLLKANGHPEMSPLAFKQKKYNWKRVATKTRKRYEQMGSQFHVHNSFLDGDLPDDEIVKCV